MTSIHATASDHGRSLPIPQAAKLAAALAMLPPEVRKTAMSDTPLVLMNGHTKELALLRRGIGREWDVEVFRIDPGGQDAAAPVSETVVVT